MIGGLHGSGTGDLLDEVFKYLSFEEDSDEEEQPIKVALLGKPNVGKSSLMNKILGQKVAIVSNKPQTTRNRIQTVLTTEEGQIVFVDTPGIHKAKNKLGEYMVNVAEKTLNEVDVILWLVEPSNFIRKPVNF